MTSVYPRELIERFVDRLDLVLPGEERDSLEWPRVPVPHAPNADADALLRFRAYGDAHQRAWQSSDGSHLLRSGLRRCWSGRSPK